MNQLYVQHHGYIDLVNFKKKKIKKKKKKKIKIMININNNQKALLHRLIIGLLFFLFEHSHVHATHVAKRLTTDGIISRRSYCLCRIRS